MTAEGHSNKTVLPCINLPSPWTLEDSLHINIGMQELADEVLNIAKPQTKTPRTSGIRIGPSDTSRPGGCSGAVFSYP